MNLYFDLLDAQICTELAYKLSVYVNASIRNLNHFLSSCIYLDFKLLDNKPVPTAEPV